VIDTTDAEQRWQLVVRHPFRGGHVEHRVNFHHLGTSGETDVPEPLKARIAGQVLLSLLPDEGLSEALVSLVRVWQVYWPLVARPPALPSPPPSIATPGGVDVEDPNVVLPPGLRGFRLRSEDAQTMQRLLDDPDHPTHEGKEMPTADASVLLKKDRASNS
jgi:hypothetical protein